MERRNDDQLHGRLAKLLANHPDENEQKLIRSALMWLGVSEKSLRTHELWVALQIEALQDVWRVERLLTEARYADDKEAASSLRDLLGDLVVIREYESCKGYLYISLKDSKLVEFLSGLRNHPETTQTIAQFAFPPSDAHLTAAKVCMIICSATTLHLAHIHEDSTASSLILYAWTYWGAHLLLSRCQLSGQAVAEQFNTMVYRVCADASVFLLELNDFITGPIKFPARTNYMFCIAAVQEAQLALARTSIALAELLRDRDCSTALQDARAIIEGSDGNRTKERIASRGRLRNNCSLTGVHSSTETLSMDQHLRETVALLGSQERHMILIFADSARGLRSVCVRVARSPVYEALLSKYDHSSSLLDILVNLANWMEAVAGYPYWKELSGSNFHDAFMINDPSDPSFDTAQFIKSKMRAIGAASSQSSEDDDQIPAADSLGRTCGMSRTRWYLSSLVYKIMAHGQLRAGSSIIVNDPRLLSRRISSFAAVPSYMHSPSSPMHLVQALIPDTLHRICRQGMNSLLVTLHASEAFVALSELGSGTVTGSITTIWPQTMPALLSSGYTTAVVLFGIAVLVHHIRRMLVPWLGSWFFVNPLEDLRIALGSPDYFLDEALDIPWLWMAFMYFQKWIFDIIGSLLVFTLMLNNGRVPPPILTRARARARTHSRIINVDLLLERSMSIAKVFYLAWTLACAEYIFDRTLSSTAFAIAYAKLTLLSPAASPNRAALALVLRKHRTKAAVNAVQLLSYFVFGILPMVRGALVCTARGKPALLGVLGALGYGVWMLLRYRARFFIALEMSSMFVVLGCAGVLFVLLGLGFVGDPLGLKVSTAMARRSGMVLREVVPRDAEARIEILRGKAVPPVQMPHDLCSQEAEAVPSQEAAADEKKC